MIERLDAQPALTDRVLDRLVAAIADGNLSPGERLTQETVAARLGVSRQPVSHALQVLRRRGLAVESGKRGLVVAPLDARRLRHLYQVRAALDGLAARLAAERARAGVIGATLPVQAKKIMKAGIKLARARSIGELVQVDVDFHSLIYRMSGNSAIAEIVAEEWPHFMRSMGAVLAVRAIRASIWSEHARILEHILAGEPDAAETAARDHAMRAGEETAHRLETLSSVA